MLKIFSNKKGESLIEVMIAVVILAIVLISMSKVLGNSKIVATSSEERIEAVALAKEGLEIFRYFRKYNYMKYSDKKRICWNFLEDNGSNISDAYPHVGGDGILNSSDEECKENSLAVKEGSANHILIDDKKYIPVQNLSDENYGRFFLTTKGQDLNLIWDKKNDGEIFIDLEIFQLCKDLDTGLIMSCESMGLINKEKLPYFRTLKIEYVDSLGQLCSSIYSSCDTSDANLKSLNQIKVTSTVIWPSGDGVQSVDLTTVFSDYEDRLDRDS